MIGEEYILVVDDDEAVRRPVSILLDKKGYHAIICDNADSALSKLAENPVSVILTDIDMPRVSGMELLDNIRDIDPDIPVILMTGASELEHAMDAFGKGAFNFITKPCKSENLIQAIEKAARHRRLVLEARDYKKTLEETVLARTRELREALLANRKLTREITRRLIAIAEFKDPETPAHIARMGFYAREMAKALGMPGDFVDEIGFASPMHDIGKVAIPDSVLLKPGRLTAGEYEVMKSHTVIGNRLLSGSEQPGIRMAAAIALTHHERMDGSGYPAGMKGEEAPLEGRIVLVCDCYDAIRSKRPYKQALSHAEAVRLMTTGSEALQPGKHFDPVVLAAFIKAAPSFEAIFNDNLD